MTIAIPTYGRDIVLVETIRACLEQRAPAGSVLVVDQTHRHEPQTQKALADWSADRQIRVIVRDRPSIPAAMNCALCEAATPIVLFLDDDVIPQADLVQEHAHAMRQANAWAVAGQVLQPDEGCEDVAYAGRPARLRSYLDFPFRSSRGRWIENVMAGNLSVKRKAVLAIGGFDENFVPPVAYRFETEFAKRLIAAGGRIWYEPRASIRHLRASTGGTRTQGSHLMSMSPIHGVGDYYYALRCGRGWERVAYVLRRPLREVRTRFHSRHPWYIPVKLIGEMRALAWALRLHAAGPRLLSSSLREEGCKS